MKKYLFLILVITITLGCSEKQTNCDVKSMKIIEIYNPSPPSKSYMYDIEFTDFNAECVNEKSIRKIIDELMSDKYLAKPIDVVRCYKYNGGGYINELIEPTGMSMYLIITDIDSLGRYYNYEIVQED